MNPNTQPRQAADAARFVWWFSRGDCSLNEWRGIIDEAMQAEDAEQDRVLNKLLRASLEARKPSEAAT